MLASLTKLNHLLQKTASVPTPTTPNQFNVTACLPMALKAACPAQVNKVSNSRSRDAPGSPGSPTCPWQTIFASQSCSTIGPWVDPASCGSPRPSTRHSKGQQLPFCLHTPGCTSTTAHCPRNPRICGATPLQTVAVSVFYCAGCCRAWGQFRPLLWAKGFIRAQASPR